MRATVPNLQLHISGSSDGPTPTPGRQSTSTSLRPSRRSPGGSTSEGASGLYLGGFARRPLLTREDEVALAERVEHGERSMLRALLGSPIALRELAAVAEELAEGHLRSGDVLRAADETERHDERAMTSLIALLRRARSISAALERGAPATAARRALVRELERVRLHRRVLDRAAGALRAAGVGDDDAARRTLGAVEHGRRLADRARDEFVEANIRLVVSFAKRLHGQGLSLHDLIQEGNIGLVRAVDKFDHRRTIRFSTYAAWWVRQQMTRALLEQGRTIRVPVHLEETRRRTRRARQIFAQEHGREASEPEIAERTGLSSAKLRVIDELTPEPVSLDAPLGVDGDGSLGDLAADRTTPAPDEEIARARVGEQIGELMAGLSSREQEVLRRRFGLDGAPERTLSEIGASLSLSRERVRQIEAAALRRLRAPSHARELESYLGD